MFKSRFFTLKKSILISVVAALCISLLSFANLSTPTYGWGAWSKYGSNPVVAPEPFSGEPCVIYDSEAKLYKMWYTRSDGLADGVDAKLAGIIGAGGDFIDTFLTLHDFSSDPLTDADCQNFLNLFSILQKQ
jgi:hypothetical protein